jgi:sulfur-oxidizing protein SoxY
MQGRVLAVATAMLASVSAHAAGGVDPLDSEIWEGLKDAYLGDGAVVYDQAVKLTMPRVVWEPFSVPVVINLSEDLGEVSEVVLFAENNPIQAAAQIFPHRAMRAIGMDIRLERSTPVRAAALDGDGVWHVANVEVVVMSPGGCSKPGDVVADSDLGAIAMKQFDREDGASRLKVKINHPMHTGFAADEDGEPIAAYYIDHVTVEDEAGPLADLTTWAALAADPSFFFDLAEARQSVRVTASDSKGLAFEALAPAPSM